MRYKQIFLNPRFLSNTGFSIPNRYLGASYDVPSLVEKLLHQLASKQTIVVNVYDTTNKAAPINMYGTKVNDTGLLHISTLDFGDRSAVVSRDKK